MTDKLPQFVEDWIAQTTATMQLNPKYRGVLEKDLRAFLAKFVLCEREPAAWQAEASNGFQTVVIFRCVEPIGNTNYKPLHAPATEEPK